MDRLAADLNDESSLRLTLILSWWSFRRGDGSIIAEQVGFGHDGRVKGYVHSNEFSWKFDNGVLEFLSDEGNPTTRFEPASRLPDGRICFTGNYLADTSGVSRHVLEQVREFSMPPTKAKAAVLVRTHVANDKLFELLDALRGGLGYDVYIAADTTRREFPLSGSNVLPHSERMCQDLGLSLNHVRRDIGAMWCFGDYALYCSYEQKPNYDFYLMIEYDVHLTRRNSLFIEGIFNRLFALPTEHRIDYLSPEVRPCADYPEWMGVAPSGFQHFFSLVNFLVISKRALLHLYQARKRWSNGAPPELEQWYVETFVPTVLMADGSFRCQPVNLLFPGSYAIGKSYFGSNLPLLLGSAFEDDPRVEMAHPVFAAPEYLRAHLDRAVGTSKVSEFIDAILFNKDLPIPAQLREQIFAEAMARRPKG